MAGKGLGSKNKTKKLVIHVNNLAPQNTYRVGTSGKVIVRHCPRVKEKPALY
jgi:ribulose-5-phosphate 4-epimerase/fuculose-1-phosphate aldolase